MHLIEHVRLGRLELLVCGTRLSALAQLGGIPNQDVAQDLVHVLGVVRARGLGHRVLGDDAPLLEDARAEHELAAIRSCMEREVVDQAIVSRPISGLDDALEERVGLLELLVERGICLRKLEVIHVEDLKGAGAKHVQRGEHPAAARLVLMGHGLSGLERDAVGVLVGADGALVARCSGDAHRRHGVTGDPIGTAACEPVGERIDASLVDRAPWHEVRQRYAIGRTIHTINLFINLTCTFLQRAMHIMDVLYQFTIRRAARAFRTGRGLGHFFGRA